MRRSALVVWALVIAGCPSGSNVGTPAISTRAGDAMATSKNGANGRPEVHVVLDDPRLATARALERAKDFAGAAKALHDARPAELPKLDACAWDYVEGRLCLAAGENEEAAAAFARAEAAPCPLAAYARLRGAQALGRASRGEEALAKARAVGDEIALRDEAKLVISDALASKGDIKGALPIWREWLAANPYGSRWVDTTLRIANAIADEGSLREAYDLATKVVVEAPKLADSSGATTTRQRIVGLMRARDPSFTGALTEMDRAKQAQAWVDVGEPQKAWDEASSILGVVGAKITPSPAACKAAVARANAAGKLKPSRPETWNDAVTACEKDDQLVTVLYQGAKTRSGKDPKLAIEWFAKIEQQFPTHRLADDARFRGALLVAQSTEEGHEAKAEEMLRTLPEVYPNGDMQQEALFRVALAKMRRGEWAAAAPVLERILEMASAEQPHGDAAGRADYFRARVAAVGGDADGARTRYKHVVEQHPLSFYALLAYDRLAAIDAADAKKTLDDAAAKDKESGQAGPGADAIFATPAFVRGVHLLDVGEVDAARREMTAAGALGEGAAPELTWTVGALFDEAGAPDVGHALPRGKAGEFRAHYPEGKWRFPWEVAYPRAFEPLVRKACGEYACPTTLAWAIMRTESAFVPDAKSRSNAIGLMQLIEPTARWMAAGTPYGADEASLKRPEVSVEFGVKLLAQLRAKHGHPALAIGAYNGGSGAIDRWMRARSGDDLDMFVEQVPWDETRNYIKRVLATQATYAYLYDPTALGELLGLPLRFAH